MLKSNKFVYSIKQNETNSLAVLENEDQVVLNSFKSFEEKNKNMALDSDSSHLKLNKIDEISSSSSGSSSGSLSDQFNEDRVAENSAYFSVTAYNNKKKSDSPRHVNYEIFETREEKIDDQKQKKLFPPKPLISNIPIFDQKRQSMFEQKHSSFLESSPFEQIKPSFLEKKNSVFSELPRTSNIDQGRPPIAEQGRPFMNENIHLPNVEQTRSLNLDNRKQSVAIQNSRKFSISAPSTNPETSRAPIKRRMITEVIGNIGKIHLIKYELLIILNQILFKKIKLQLLMNIKMKVWIVLKKIFILKILMMILIVIIKNIGFSNHHFKIKNFLIVCLF